MPFSKPLVLTLKEFHQGVRKRESRKKRSARTAMTSKNINIQKRIY